MLVEDFAQKFKVLARRLQGVDALSNEMKISYFLNGLKKKIKVAVANVDIGVGFDDIVNVEERVEKRLGFTKKKKKKKKND